MNSKKAYLIDIQGKVVHMWKVDANSGHCALLLENGHLLRPTDLDGADRSFGGGPGALGRIQEFTWEGELVWDFKFYNDKQLFHHDLTKLPNGNVLLVVWDKKNRAGGDRRRTQEGAGEQLPAAGLDRRGQADRKDDR